jgi:hypothetical protein
MKGRVAMSVNSAFTQFLVSCIVFSASFSSIVPPTEAAAPVSLPSLNAEIQRASLSGLSSGAFMAVQLHVAHSSVFKGVGVFAGGPYYCSQGKILNAVGRCMGPKDDKALPNVEELKKWTRSQADDGKIDPIEHMKESKIWILSGTTDKTVFPSVVKKLQEYYTGFVNPENIVGIFDMDAGHALITEDYGNDCSETKPPFINHCKFDGAGKLLAHIYGSLNAPSDTPEGEIIEFNQNDFIEEKEATHHCMAEKGYVYVPKICNTERCGIHIFLHGCKQYAGKIGREIIEKGGFNRWADRNKLIILYPQTTSWASPDKSEAQQFQTQNPFGCWDWWGYSHSDFYSKGAPQIKAIMKMLDRLVQPS